jgi:hypothetical protein
LIEKLLIVTEWVTLAGQKLPTSGITLNDEAVEYSFRQAVEEPQHSVLKHASAARQQRGTPILTWHLRAVETPPADSKRPKYPHKVHYLSLDQS